MDGIFESWIAWLRANSGIALFLMLTGPAWIDWRDRRKAAEESLVTRDDDPIAAATLRIHFTRTELAFAQTAILALILWRVW